ncbi:DUF6544 family protein [Allomuricauda sp. F6463D]|uniref:DUF6544 family protein n=1 Tax=Allomuricauda sp. F6463D TaxID=2926409 RepID=UPI001FF5E0DC|nr:DUF6544 family protein [Muricauda sp. F6463D]MCK0159551.1 hypothetical protein [Muricauda sp. F6463D]
MKFVFTFMLVIHALIHLMGFVKAFQLAPIHQLSQDISKPVGVLWLLTFLLFVFGAIVFVMKKDWWFFVVIIAVVLSQILIIMYWNDAKFGTLPNIIILLVCMSAWGSYQFNIMVEKEVNTVLSNSSTNKTMISNERMHHLPEIVQKWLNASGVVGKEKVDLVKLKQAGEMRTQPKGKWMPFTAEQYFDVEHPSFVWSTEVTAFSSIKMIGRDKFYDGTGSMLIKLASLIPVVDESDNEQINTGTMLRFLGEICWFPSAALNDYITWEAIDATSAKATFTLDDKHVSGIFKFNNNGDMVSFEADRFYGGGKNATLEKWVINVTDYKVYHGVKIPYKCKVLWKLPDGDFNWLNLEITKTTYN